MLTYSDEPVNKVRGITVGHPFYNLNQRFSVAASVLSHSGRRDQYLDGQRIAGSQSEGDKVIFEAKYRFGEYLRKIGLKFAYAYVFETNRDRWVDSAYADVLPISPVRAFSQMQNPYGHPEDVALLVAYDGNRCVGYIVTLPGLVKCDGQLSKIYYVTTYFVSPEFRRKGIGFRLLNELKQLPADIVSTGMTQSAVRAFKKALFKDLLAHQTWNVAAISFAGMLELFKEQKLYASQEEPYAEIQIEWLEAGLRQEDQSEEKEAA